MYPAVRLERLFGSTIDHNKPFYVFVTESCPVHIVKFVYRYVLLVFCMFNIIFAWYLHNYLNIAEPPTALLST